MRVLFALHRIGPYHRARLLAAAGTGLELTVLQTRPQSQEYPWAFDPRGPYVIADLTEARHREADPPVAVLDSQLKTLLERCKPDAIVSVGWADRAYQRLLLLAHRHRIPVVIVSDSRQRDEPRSAAKEWIKSQLLRGYSSALVAGSESRRYLEILGFPAEAIFQPWDVVDNAFFAAATTHEPSCHPHFLCVSRLVSKKNHQGLLYAYAAYQRRGGNWGLRLIGSGPLEQAIRAQIAALPEPFRVELLPFCQLHELRQHYGRASAFVLASSTDQWGLVINEAVASGLPCIVSDGCGCAADLIENGISGWSYSPANPESLALLMSKCEEQPAKEREIMIAAARKRLDNFSVDSFSANLLHSIRYAVLHNRFSRRSALTAKACSRL